MEISYFAAETHEHDFKLTEIFSTCIRDCAEIKKNIVDYKHKYKKIVPFLAQLVSCATTNCPVHVIGGGIGSELDIVDRLLTCKSYAYTMKQKSHTTL